MDYILKQKKQPMQNSKTGNGGMRSVDVQIKKRKRDIERERTKRRF